MRKAREEQGLSLNDVQEKTKIRIKYLHAIENEKFDLIPGKIYVKVFIKGYAEQVGLNGVELAQEYQEILDEEAKIEEEEQEDNNGEKAFFQNRLLNIIILIFILLVLVVVILNVFLLNDSQNAQDYNLQTSVNTVDKGVSTEGEIKNFSSNNGNVNDEIKDIKKDIKTSNTNSTGVSDINTEPAGVNNNLNTINTTTNAGFKVGQISKKEIEIVVTEKSWLQVSVDGKKVFQGILRKGVSKKISSDKRIDLKIGNAAGILVKKGEKTLGPWGEHGEVIEKSF